MNTSSPAFIAFFSGLLPTKSSFPIRFCAGSTSMSIGIGFVGLLFLIGFTISVMGNVRFARTSSSLLLPRFIDGVTSMLGALGLILADEPPRTLLLLLVLVLGTDNDLEIIGLSSALLLERSFLDSDILNSTAGLASLLPPVVTAPAPGGGGGGGCGP